MDGDVEDIVEVENNGKTDITVVKCAIGSVLRMPAGEKARFIVTIEGYVETISRMMRQASLALLYNLTTKAERGEALPDLMREKTNGMFWRRWLCLDVRNLVSDDVWDVISSRIRDPDIDANVLGVDRPLAYAAITLATVVKNNAWVPLVRRIARLTGAVVRRYGVGSEERKLSRFLISKIRGMGNPDLAGLPSWASTHVEAVRDKLRMDGTSYLFDEYGKRLDFDTLFMFNFWMQQQFVTLKERRLALSPVLGVRRQHIRLDRKSLLDIACHLHPEAPEVVAYKIILPSMAVEKPRAPKKSEIRCTECHDRGKSRRSCGECAESRLDARKAYDVEKAQVPERMKARKLEVDNLKSDKDYKREKSAATMAVVRALFIPKLPVRTLGGWSFDPSITTDGVSVSLQFSRPKMRKSTTKAVPSTIATVDEYDFDLSTVTSGANGDTIIVAGVDPGRVSIASVAVLDAEGKTHAWSLSGGQYHTESGSRRQTSLKQRRDQVMRASWQELGCWADDEVEQRALRTPSTEELGAYLRQYTLIRRQWWDHALKRRESRANLQRYIGKRGVLDRFWTRVKTELRQIFPNAERRCIAYGSAFSTMSPTGRGEVAVPTSQAFKSCRRIFGASDVGVVDEFRTTAFEWESGVRKKVVYRRAGAAGECGGVTLNRRSAALSDKGYPKEVRGLRFSPERRMFLNRDIQSAVTIARLRVMELGASPMRPRLFSRG